MIVSILYKGWIPLYKGKSDFGEIYPTVRMYCTSPKKIAMLDDILMFKGNIGDVTSIFDKVKEVTSNGSEIA